MLDILSTLDAWRLEHVPIAVATVVETWGSAPRPVGSKLIATGDGRFAGSVSAGCVEGAVLEECAAVLRSGASRLLSYGVADDTAWEVGLACGGTIRIAVEPFAAWSAVYAPLHEHLEASRPVALVSFLPGDGSRSSAGKLLVTPGGQGQGDLDLGEWREPAIEAALAQLAQGAGAVITLEGGPSIFVEVYPVARRLIIVGAVHTAIPLIGMARLAGFEAIVVDPRPAFATSERFPDAAAVVRGWPEDELPGLGLDDATYVVVLTHDPKIDDPALRLALSSGTRYIGALGSKRTNRLRIERLRAAGVSDEAIARLHAPIGLDLGGRTPAEIAVSILAELVQVANRSATPTAARQP